MSTTAELALDASRFVLGLSNATVAVQQFKGAAGEVEGMNRSCSCLARRLRNPAQYFALALVGSKVEVGLAFDCVLLRRYTLRSVRKRPRLYRNAVRPL